MRLKSLLITSIIALGTLPLLTLVSINLKDHIERHENATRQAMAARASIAHRALKKKASHLLADLEKTAMAAAPAGKEWPRRPLPIPALLNQWFGGTPELLRLQVVSGNDVILEMTRETPLSPLTPAREPPSSPPPRPATLPACALDTGDDALPLLILSVPVATDRREWLRAEIALGRFTNEFGPYLLSGGKNPALLAAGKHLAEPLERPVPAGVKPVLQNLGYQYILWLPLTIAGTAPVAWVGQAVDTSAAQRWKQSLIVNIMALLVVTFLAVTLVAGLVVRKVERVKRELVEGIKQIVNDARPVEFSWKFPLELRRLAQDLTDLSRSYRQTRAASEAARQKLAESENRFRKLTASAQDGIVLMDHRGKIAYWNQAAERIFGFTDHEAMGRFSHQLLNLRRPDVPEAEALADDISIPAPGRPDVIELVAERSDGRDIPIELSLSSTKIQGEWHAIWIIRDISDRKRAEAEARLRQRQLIFADKMRSLGLLVAGVAHEINNPNSIALLNTSLLAKAWNDIIPVLDRYHEQHGDFMIAGLSYDEMRDQIPRLHAELYESAKRVKTIVMDLKEYARQEPPRASALVDMNEVVRTAARLTQNRIKKATARFDTALSQAPVLVRGHKQRLEQVMINLLQNACDAVSGEEGAIEITVARRRKTRAVTITVADNGVGIAPDDVNLVTDPFFTTKRDQGGTGLGLSVSAGIIKEHQGEIRFTSRVGSGTTVTVTLPLADPEDDQ